MEGGRDGRLADREEEMGTERNNRNETEDRNGSFLKGNLPGTPV